MAGEEDHHDEQEEHGEKCWGQKGQRDEHDEDGKQVIGEITCMRKPGAFKRGTNTEEIVLNV